ncbi:helix-turn-helix domain-containing protein [Dactylosporangium sp. NBC_01737]|uniref:helix-turn-helix transcriptional regulator n=1 Tax=Dactylosporangium sp. NBC_01737 TaxID=2975959 RepID=UPI002E0E8D8B|nr:helix-turn-helix domain-containing protein [Dactylosporangium sp. NBC_01737]
MSTTRPRQPAADQGRGHLLTVDEVAAYLRIPQATLYQWRYHRTGPRAIKVGRHLRYRAVDVETWLDSQAA